MKPFTLVAVVVFVLVAVLQGLRLAMGWEITVDGMIVPIWASGVVLVMAGGLAVLVGREARQ